MSNVNTKPALNKATRAAWENRVAALKGMLARLQAASGESAGKDVCNMLGMGKTGINHHHYFSEQISAQCDAWGLNVDSLFNPACNPKATMRFVQFIGAVHHEQYAQIDRTTACILLGLHLAGDFPLTTGALWEIATGGKVKSEGMGENRRGVSTRTIARMMGSVGVSTIDTQLSRSVGKNGFLQAVNATSGDPGKQNRPVMLNRKNPLVVAFIALIDKGTDSQIDSMVKDK